jgi:hydrogenase maturation protein HypF
MSDFPHKNAPGVPLSRLNIRLRGAVQGVGFRPFVYRTALELNLSGWVQNSSAGVEIEAEGPEPAVERFLKLLHVEKPSAAVVQSQEVKRLDPTGLTGFTIRQSDGASAKQTGVLPDLATCDDCLAEMLNPANRRSGYPFTNCTHCGPRYTIIEDIPYDRPNTTMREFDLCSDCRREYEDPLDRRFHAQPIACPACGPKLDATIAEAVAALEQGHILALKGIGGFQLLVDARNEDAVRTLRQRKHREEKPFALMVAGLAEVRRYCAVSAAEEELLLSPAAPIVLLQPNGKVDLAPAVARSSPYLGVMLPCSPLHHLLMGMFPHPVVATSGNRSDEPIAADNEEARVRLGGIADTFLTHNRPIARPCDDSVVRLSRGLPVILRRARGYAPLPIPVSEELPPVLAVGGHLKNTVAIALGRQVILSQHIGDLDTLEARRSFERAIDDLCRLYDFHPEAVVCDLHPDYASTRWARDSGLPVIAIQHHHAHVAACAAEHNVPAPYLGVSWDGTGYGLDGTVWGGEFFRVENGAFERVAHLRPFPLPGGEAAIREGWRSAASLRHLLGRPSQAPGPVDEMLERDINCPRTSSAGRLFDAVAAILGIASENRFEGQAAMRLEWAIGNCRTDEAYPLRDGNWEDAISAILDEAAAGVDTARIAARFHNTMAGWILATAQQNKFRRIILSGGVFQNRYLTERTSLLLEECGYEVFTHREVPPNDGGISLGQAVLAPRGIT